MWRCSFPMGTLGLMRACRVTGMLFVMVTLSGKGAKGDDNNHKYDLGDKVNLWVNKVGSVYNPQESYPYYSLPYCKPTNTEAQTNKRKRAGLGEILAGNKLRNSGLDIEFGVTRPKTDVCTTVLNQETADKFREAVKQRYLVNMYLDDLPIWNPVGRAAGENHIGMKISKEGDAAGVEKGEEHLIYGHRRFQIGFNGNRVIAVNLTSHNPQPIVPEGSIHFTYEVEWKQTTVAFKDRFDRYLEYGFFEHQIHWFSIFNSFMMVIFLCGLVSLILVRTLRNDFAKYTSEDDLEGPDLTLGEDSGWKQIHGDVFRPPEYLMLFSALHGTGCQLVVLVLGVVLFAIAGPLHGDVYEERGELVSTFIVCYALTSFVAGYTSGSYYRQFFTTPRAEQGSQWQKTMLLTVGLFPSVVLTTSLLLNMVAVSYNTMNTLPFWAVVKVLAIWAFVSFPLCVVGSMFGRHWGGRGNFPCRVNSIPRAIPEGAWYSRPAAVICLAGILPFGSIFIEMYFILTSFWSYKFYYVYNFMLLVLVILVAVLICTTIVAVYFVLNAENHRWQWVAFLSGGSTAGYVFLYSLYYFYFKTEQYGFLQISFYFGSMSLFCAALFVMCGSIGVIGSSAFVKQIYRNIKVD